MKISYASRSKFMAPCKENITAQQEALESGKAIHFSLLPKGYPGDVMVTISADDPSGFEADWEASDPTRFPARIKAAATALRDCGSVGKFTISHRSGKVSIRRA